MSFIPDASPLVRAPRKTAASSSPASSLRNNSEAVSHRALKRERANQRRNDYQGAYDLIGMLHGGSVAIPPSQPRNEEFRIEKKTALHGFITDYNIFEGTSVDVEAYARDLHVEAFHLCMEQLALYPSFRIQIGFTIKKSKNSEAIKDGAFVSFSHWVHSVGDINATIDQCLAELLEQIDTFNQNGSGVQIEGVSKGQIKFIGQTNTGSSVLRAGRMNALPGRACCKPEGVLLNQKKRYIVNPTNEDDMCFKWALESMRVGQNPGRIENIWKCVDEHGYAFDYMGMSFPPNESDINLFEEQNRTLIGIFGYEKQQNIFVAIRSPLESPNIIQARERKWPVQHLLLIEGHPWVKLPNGKLEVYTSTTTQHYCHIRNLNKFLNSGEKDSHSKSRCPLCYIGFDNGSTSIGGEERVKKHLATERCSLEHETRLLLPEPDSSASHMHGFTGSKIRKMVQSEYVGYGGMLQDGSWFFKVECWFDPAFGFVRSGLPGTADQFISQLDEAEKLCILHREKHDYPKQGMPLTATHCHICTLPMSTGCLPDMHPSQNYQVGSKRKISASMKQMNNNYPVQDHCHVTKNDNIIGVAHYWCNLQRTSGWSNDPARRLRWYIPIVMDDLSCIPESVIVKASQLGGKLAAIRSQDGGFISLTYNRLRFVSANAFMGKPIEYQSTSLSQQVQQMADIMNRYRKIMLREFRLEPLSYCSASGIAEDVGLQSLPQITDSDGLTLYQDIRLFVKGQEDILDWVRTKCLRGGICQVMKRQAVAIPGKVQIRAFDVNSEYPHVCQQPVPTGDYQWCTEETLGMLNDPPQLLSIGSDAPTGYWLECSAIKFRPEMKNRLRHFPPFPEARTVQYSELSPYQHSLLEKHKIRYNERATRLIMDLNDKVNHACHYRTLQFWLSQGVIESYTVSKALQFSQAAILSGFANKCWNLRHAVDKDLASNFKLLPNAFIGRCGMNVERHTKTKIMQDEVDVEENVFKLASHEILGEDLVVGQLEQDSVKYDRPVLISATIYELARLHLAQKWTMLQTIFGERISLLYTDTDSLFCEIHTECWEKEVHAAGMQDEFDFSKHSDKWFSPTSIMGALKSDTGSIDIEVFYANQSKSYFYRRADEKVKRGLGGVDRGLQDELKEEMYQHCIQADEYSIAKWKLKRGEVNVLVPFDSKCYQVDAGTAVPHGMFSN